MVKSEYLMKNLKCKRYSLYRYELSRLIIYILYYTCEELRMRDIRKRSFAEMSLVYAKDVDGRIGIYL